MPRAIRAKNRRRRITSRSRDQGDFMRAALLSCLIAAAAGLAACATPRAAAPANPWMAGVKFAPMGSAEKAEAATVAGSQREAALYTIRVHVAKGGHIAPHTHPDTRILTVVSGEVVYGFGAEVDMSRAKLYRAGDVFTVPANAPHWAEATTSDVVYQEAGMGPTAFRPVRPSAGQVPAN
jgi:quercetin dioxygenase-like cupin family protein